MSQYTRFPDPTETANPFQDPAVTQHHTPSTGYATLDLYNPFDSSRGPPPPYEPANQTPVGGVVVAPGGRVPSSLGPSHPMTPRGRVSPTARPHSVSSCTARVCLSCRGRVGSPCTRGGNHSFRLTVTVRSCHLLEARRSLIIKLLVKAGLDHTAVQQESHSPPPLMKPQTRNATAAATAELLRRQEELEKKAADLERRERELQSAGLGNEATRQNNWPPFPSFCPIQPCFYQDISVEIGQDFQRTVSTMYYFWMFSGCTLIFNFIANLALFCVDTSAGVGLGLAILWILIFTPCSFLCWYRPMYKAFRSDSSFNFFFFFFVFFVQVTDIQYFLSAGLCSPSCFSGWIVSLAALKVNVAVAVIMLLTAVMFTGTAVVGVIMLKKIHSLYRRTGASFQKAQAEFTTGVLSNEAVRTAAASAATGIEKKGH
ncbi:secretory carrier-associated membrane protein 3-like [Polyodon spathula]|uniref:secretory carrier-associated membrane protein 3-like n=1 Tax=Polyodon spathula TaxID=7913 RepID=UPI001B7ED2C0|nr:secretory carrier-associated membrane protein 3-like [Polyodon spathula]